MVNDGPASIATKLVLLHLPEFKGKWLLSKNFASPSKTQIINEISNYRIMTEPRDYRPKVFFGELEKRGMEAPFPT